LESAILALEDGTVFKGRSFGAPAERSGEVVFNTALTGYQEIFTDPSYSGQIVILTNPQIGNYGTSIDDNEAGKPWIEGLVVREFSSLTSNWRSDDDAWHFLAKNQIPVVSELDTRALVRHLRTKGVMRGVLSATESSGDALVRKAREIPSMTGLDLASRVTTAARYEWTQTVDACSPSEVVSAPAPQKYHVVAYDHGIKRNILRRLAHTGCRVTVVPSLTSAEDVLSLQPDGVFLSNGPGDPEPLETQVANIRKLMGRTPVFGICLGHQLMGLACGGKTYKLKFGHRGANHPVLNQLTQKVEITSHNHGFAVDPDSLKYSDVALTHVNLNDQTLEGFRHRNYPAFCVQYHPEAAPGPHDSLYLFDDFVKLMNDFKSGGAR
jgi:carbamoyl-phosphate synthase small subunit